MIIKISEVWNGGTDGVKELAVIETVGAFAKEDVFSWISKNRPDSG